MTDAFTGDTPSNDALSRATLSADALLSDEQMLAFIALGFIVLRPTHPAGYNERMHEALGRPGVETGPRVTEDVPALFEVCERPQVRGALTSLLGPDYVHLRHRNLYVNRPGSRSQGWHQDDDAVHRLREVSTLALFYYPHDVTLDMGPTVLLPGSHLREASLDQLSMYANIHGQRFMAVPAGTVVLIHGGLWHAATLNRSAIVRYMMKFLFARQTPPKRPSWRHDPQRSIALLRRHLRMTVPPVLSQCSDALEEWRRRLALWNWLRGDEPPLACDTTLDVLNFVAR